jgi:hypothetical protein
MHAYGEAVVARLCLLPRTDRRQTDATVPGEAMSKEKKKTRGGSARDR